MLSSGVVSHRDIAIESNDLTSVCNWRVVDDTLGSDHLPILNTINKPVIIEKVYQPNWCYRKADWRIFKADCSRNIIVDIMTDDVIESCDIVNGIISLAENTHSSLPTVNTSRHASAFVLDKRIHEFSEGKEQG